MKINFKSFVLILFTLFFHVSCMQNVRQVMKPGIPVLEFREENYVSDGSEIPLKISVYTVKKVFDERSAAVILEFTSDDAHAFADITAKNIGKKLSVAAGDKILVTAMVLQRIDGGKLLITFPTSEEAENLFSFLTGE